MLMVRLLFIILLFSLLSNSLVAQSLHPDLDKDKVSPLLEVKKENNEVRLLVSNPKAFKEWVKNNLPDVYVKENSANIFSFTTLTEENLKQLAKLPWIKFIDNGNRKAIEERALGNFDLTLNRVSSVQTLYPDNKGEDITISIKEKPFDKTDIDLKNRVVLTNQFDEDSTIHASIMATIVAGAGNSEPSGKGVAVGAKVTTSDFEELLPDNGFALSELGVTVQNHSYGVGNIENYYGIESREYDKHCQEFPTIVHVFSSGNQGDKADNSGTYAGLTGVANLTGQFKISKNTLSVGSADLAGNVTVKSSRGPASDGRVKPELIAYGDAGSSDAAAIVSGMVALVQQAYLNQYASIPESALVKAILITSADDTGRPEVDFESGYGNADALGALELVEQGNFFSGIVNHDEEKIHTITIPPNTYRVKVTLAWNDIEGTLNASKALINDVDLSMVHQQSGTRWLPWVLNHQPASVSLPAERKEDHLNVVEQITITLQESGNYNLIVKGASIIQPQAYHLVYEFESGFKWTFPLEGNSFVANRNTFIRWQWNSIPTTGQLEFKYENETGWIEIDNQVDLSKQYFTWLTPDTTSRVQLRMVTNETTYTTDLFLITQPIPLKVGYNCENELLFIWNKIPAADHYQLFKLGEKQLEPFITTSDTFAILTSADKEILYYAVSPIIQTMAGEKGTTINYANQITGCYLINFLPRQYVFTDDITFDLKIGTTYKLGSAIMERYSNAGWQIIQAINPVTAVDLVFVDENPAPGVNEYRIRLTDSNNSTILIGNPEEVFYVRKNDLIVYPNPAKQGESITLIINDENVVAIKLYDMLGKPALETSDLGYVKSVTTKGLTRGNYILEIIKSTGQKLTKRIAIF